MLLTGLAVGTALFAIYKSGLVEERMNRIERQIPRSQSMPSLPPQRFDDRRPSDYENQNSMMHHQSNYEGYTSEEDSSDQSEVGDPRPAETPTVREDEEEAPPVEEIVVEVVDKVEKRRRRKSSE